MGRTIEGLTRAEFCTRPKGIPLSRPRGAKAAGLRYERAFAKAAPFSLHGPWLAFADANGPGYCQPDFLMRLEETPVVIEAKLTDVEGGRKQLSELYIPTLELALGESVAPVVLVRHLSALKNCSQRYDLFDSLRAAVLSACAQRSRLAIFHWRERTPLGLGTLRPSPPLKGLPHAKAA